MLKKFDRKASENSMPEDSPTFYSKISRAATHVKRSASLSSKTTYMKESREDIEQKFDQMSRFPGIKLDEIARRAYRIAVRHSFFFNLTNCFLFCCFF